MVVFGTATGEGSGHCLRPGTEVAASTTPDGRTVVVTSKTDGRGVLLAVDATTGEAAWTAERPSAEFGDGGPARAPSDLDGSPLGETTVGGPVRRGGRGALGRACRDRLCRARTHRAEAAARPGASGQQHAIPFGEAVGPVAGTGGVRLLPVPDAVLVLVADDHATTPVVGLR